MLGSSIIGSLNIAIAIISKHASEGNEFIIFILLVLLIMTFAATLGPVAWVNYLFNIFIRVLFLK